jgi:hypothetical protein
MDWLTGVADKRLRGDIEVEDNADVDVDDVAEKTLEGGFEIGVSRSDEYSKPGRFPRCSESEGSEVVVYMLQMY